MYWPEDSDFGFLLCLTGRCNQSAKTLIVKDPQQQGYRIQMPKVETLVASGIDMHWHFAYPFWRHPKITTAIAVVVPLQANINLADTVVMDANRA